MHTERLLNLEASVIVKILISCNVKKEFVEFFLFVNICTCMIGKANSEKVLNINGLTLQLNFRRHFSLRE